jgi:glycine C-acetyltransferase/8-amino-7-oxononanoate synthase
VKILRAWGGALLYQCCMTVSPPLQQVERTCVRDRNRKLIYFAGCDYFRLASHPQVLKAAAGAVTRYGLNVSASRVTTGNHVLYEKLERDLANFFAVPEATLASNGYVPNLMVAQALAGQFSHALIDERAHGCLADAAQLLDCPVIKFRHRDAGDLARIVGRLNHSKPLLLTDGLFSHDGSIAPLKEYLAVLPAQARVLLDDAHGAGVLGKNGRGTPEHFGVSRERIIQTITLSKGFGAYGGAVLGPGELRAAIVSGSRAFSGNTPLPLPLAAAAIAAVKILKNDRKLRARLGKNVGFVKGKLISVGFEIADSPVPIFSITPRDTCHAETLKRRLLAQKIYPPFIKYPGGPPSGFFRFAISSEHTRAQLDALVGALAGDR